jgi:uncharacterized protein
VILPKSRAFCSRATIVGSIMPPLAGLRVVRSSIHGYGVLATRDFAPGDVIADVDGVLRREDDLTDDTYCLWMDDGIYLDMVDQTRWINHSCEPNAEIEGEVEGDGAWARVVAVRPIRAGEEITYDYGFPASLAEPCGCGAPTCRKFIVAVEELGALAVAR